MTPHQDPRATHSHARLSLLLLQPGSVTILAELGVEISIEQRDQLAAYGLIPGAKLTVLQQRPLTVILVDQLELALEHDISRELWVESPCQRP